MDRFRSDVAISTELEFQKTGKEIQDSISGRIIELAKNSEERKVKMVDICKSRDVDLQEVLDAGDDTQRIETYSSKMSASIGNVKTRSVLEDLQKDLDYLRTATIAIHHNKRLTEHLERVAKNLKPESSNKLNYSELVLFGF